MQTFSIAWSTPDHRFGFVTIEECLDLDDAVDHWMNNKPSMGIPWDASIDEIKPIAA